MINAALNLMPGAVGQSRPQIIGSQISTTQPAPTSYADPLYIDNPAQTGQFWTIQDWTVDHGGTLPQQGAACALVYDYNGVLRCIWWEGMYSAPAPGGAAGGVLAGTYPNPSFAQNPPGFEWSYTQITSIADITDTSESTATALISPAAFTPDGSAVICEFGCADVVMPTVSGATVIVSLFEGNTQVTRLAAIENPTAASGGVTPVYVRYRFTPTNASHTYKLTAYATSTSGTPAIVAGPGGMSGYPPAFVRFTKV